MRSRILFFLIGVALCVVQVLLEHAAGMRWDNGPLRIVRDFTFYWSMCAIGAAIRRPRKSLAD